MSPMPLAEFPIAPTDLGLVHSALTDLHATATPLHPHEAGGHISDTAPLDPSEANQVAKFIFYCGYEILAAHPSLRAASMLGRAGCSLISIAETSSDSSLSNSEHLTHMIDARECTTHLNNAAQGAAPLPADAPTMTALRNVPAQEAIQNNRLALENTGKALSISGDAIAAAGYIAGVFNANLLSAALIDSGFGLLTVNCVLKSYEALLDAQTLHKSLSLLDEKAQPDGLTHLLKNHLEKKRNAALCNMAALAGYGAAFTVSYAAPYTALALFTSFIGTDYSGKFAFNTVNEPPKSPRLAALQELDDAVLRALLDYCNREKKIFALPTKERARSRPHTVLRAVLAHEKNLERLKKNIEKITAKDGNRSRISDDKLWEFITTLTGDTAQIPAPETLSQELYARAFHDGKINFYDPNYLQRVQDFVTNKGLDDAAYTSETGDTTTANKSSPEKKSTDKSTKDTLDPLLAALAFLELPTDTQQLETAQLYERAYQHFPAIGQDRAQCFDAVCTALQTHLLANALNKAGE